MFPSITPCLPHHTPPQASISFTVVTLCLLVWGLARLLGVSTQLSRFPNMDTCTTPPVPSDVGAPCWQNNCAQSRRVNRRKREKEIEGVCDAFRRSRCCLFEWQQRSCMQLSVSGLTWRQFAISNVHQGGLKTLSTGIQIIHWYDYGTTEALGTEVTQLWCHIIEDTVWSLFIHHSSDHRRAFSCWQTSCWSFCTFCVELDAAWHMRLTVCHRHMSPCFFAECPAPFALVVPCWRPIEHVEPAAEHIDQRNRPLCVQLSDSVIEERSVKQKDMALEPVAVVFMISPN